MKINIDGNSKKTKFGIGIGDVIEIRTSRYGIRLARIIEVLEGMVNDYVVEFISTMDHSSYRYNPLTMIKVEITKSQYNTLSALMQWDKNKPFCANDLAVNPRNLSSLCNIGLIKLSPIKYKGLDQKLYIMYYDLCIKAYKSYGS